MESEEENAPEVADALGSEDTVGKASAESVTVGVAARLSVSHGSV